MMRINKTNQAKMRFLEDQINTTALKFYNKYIVEGIHSLKTNLLQTTKMKKFSERRIGQILTNSGYKPRRH